MERPLDTIRSFNAAAEGTSSRRSSLNSRPPSQIGWNNDMNRRGSYYSSEHIIRNSMPHLALTLLQTTATLHSVNDLLPAEATIATAPTGLVPRARLRKNLAPLKSMVGACANFRPQNTHIKMDIRTATKMDLRMGISRLIRMATTMDTLAMARTIIAPTLRIHTSTHMRPSLRVPTSTTNRPTLALKTVHSINSNSFENMMSSVPRTPTPTISRSTSSPP